MPAPDNTPAGPAPDRPPKRRRFWQIHLSTAIFSVFASAWLLGLNLLPSEHRTGTGVFVVVKSYGWPLHGCWHYCYETIGAPETLVEIPDARAPVRLRDLFGFDDEWDNKALTFNALVCVNIILVATWLFEYLIRRRSRP
jgi:hypothetical protein